MTPSSRNIVTLLLRKVGIRAGGFFSHSRRTFVSSFVSAAAAGTDSTISAGTAATSNSINAGDLHQHDSAAAVFQLLEKVETGALSPKVAEKELKRIWKASVEPREPDETLKSFANLDHRRSSRAGFPEVRRCCISSRIHFHIC
jgi:hypothetical protein